VFTNSKASRSDGACTGSNIRCPARVDTDFAIGRAVWPVDLTLWSEDMQHDMTPGDGLRIVNPFGVAG